MRDHVKESGSEIIKADVAKLTDLVDYQKDAIVSRTIIDKEIGTVTLFAFDEGQKLSEHRRPLTP